MVRYSVYFAGRVQGVGFRYTTINVARRFTVAGHVRNTRDCRVELVVEGEAAELDRYVAAVLDAMAGYVREHAIDRGDPTGEYGEPAPGNVSVRY